MSVNSLASSPVSPPAFRMLTHWLCSDRSGQRAAAPGRPGWPARPDPTAGAAAPAHPSDQASSPHLPSRYRSRRHNPPSRCAVPAAAVRPAAGERAWQARAARQGPAARLARLARACSVCGSCRYSLPAMARQPCRDASGRPTADKPDGRSHEEQGEREEPAAFDPLERPEPAAWIVGGQLRKPVMEEILHGQSRAGVEGPGWNTSGVTARTPTRPRLCWIATG